MLLRKEQSARTVVRPKIETPIRIESASAALSLLTVVFDQPVVLKGTPAYTTDVAGAAPLSATLSNPSTVVITFDNDLTTATSMTVPFEDPAIRNAVGGFVADSTFPI
jgi:hypothetical protein